MNPVEIGTAIRYAREAAGLSAQQAADNAEMSRSWWRNIELGYEKKGGERKPVIARPETLARMCQVVGLDPADFLARAGFRESAPQANDFTAQVTPRLDTDGLNTTDLQRVQAYIDGLRAGKVT